MYDYANVEYGIKICSRGCWARTEHNNINVKPFFSRSLIYSRCSIRSETVPESAYCVFVRLRNEYAHAFLVDFVSSIEKC